MADEEHKMTKDSQTLHDAETGKPVKATPEYTPDEAEELGAAGELQPDALVDFTEAAEDLAEESPVVEGFDKAVTAVQEAFDELAEDTSTPHTADYHDTVLVLGREVTVPGGIYTVVFGALAVFTLIEVLLAEMPRGFLTIPLMLSLAFVKGLLVVAYYMHLREDSRLFTIALVIPALVMAASVLFLLTVPITGY